MKTLQLDVSLCLACGGCAGICPEMCLDLSGDLVLHVDQKKCTHCGRCVMVCPVNALKINHEEHEGKNHV